MKIRIGQLWKVPVFCLAAGYISFYVYVFLVSRFGIKVLPDGSYTAVFSSDGIPQRITCGNRCAVITSFTANPPPTT